MLRNSSENADNDSCGDSPRLLLFGYNGATNTGSEARLLTIIEDVRAVLGHDVQITIPTLNEANLRRYIQESPNLHIAPVPPLLLSALHRLVREHDMLMLVEGSCYMDTWTPALLWAFLWATHCAHSMGKPCLAYAVDAGEVSPVNRWLVRHEASQTNLIVTRTRAAAERLRTWGVTAPMEVTADCAFAFRTDPKDEDFLQREWPAAAEGAVGIAVVDFHLWPVKIQPWGRKAHCYRWPYYFSRDPERCQASQELAAQYAMLADDIVAEHHRPVALICMEQVDEPLAREVQRCMVHAGQARVFSSREYNASQMTVLLRSLDLLITSRYHAAVLSLAAHVPQVAVGHDLRLASLYEELGLKEEYFVKPGSPAVWPFLRAHIDALLADPARQREALQQGNREQVRRASRNRRLLRGFVAAHGVQHRRGVQLATPRSAWSPPPA